MLQVEPDAVPDSLCAAKEIGIISVNAQTPLIDNKKEQYPNGKRDMEQKNMFLRHQVGAD